MPVSWKGTLVQFSGRLQRRHPWKTEARIEYDEEALRHFNENV
jgi:hypothetical protein